MLKWLLFTCFALLSANEDKLVDTVIQGRLEFFRAGSINSPIPGSAFHQVGGSYVYVSGIDYAVWNGIIGSDKEPTDEQVKMAIGYFGSLKLPFMWWTESNLEKYGFTFGGILNGIALDISKVLPEAPLSTAVIKIADEYTLRDACDICANAFNMNEDSYYQAMYESMKKGDMIHFVAYIEEKPVGTISLCTGEAAGLWNLATLPEYRKQGVGSALAYAALIEAKNRNYDRVMAILMPKGMAWGLFAKLGFKSVLQFPFYIYGFTGDLE